MPLTLPVFFGKLRIPMNRKDLLKTAAATAAALVLSALWSTAAQAQVAPAAPAGLAGEMVLTTRRPASFAQAQAAEVREVADGDEVWLAVRLPQPFTSVALEQTHAGMPELYDFEVRVTRQPEGAAFPGGGACTWTLTPKEAASQELVLGLVPVAARTVLVDGGRFVKDLKTTCLLRTVADHLQRPGRNEVWVTLVSLNETNGSKQKTIAAAPLTLNLPSGFPRWFDTLQRSGGGCDSRPQAKTGAVIYCKR